MDILITGGTGFIGQALCKRFLPKHHVIVLSRQPKKVKSLYGDTVTAISDLREIIKNQHIDIIINLAGEPIFDKRWSTHQKRILVDSRVKTTNDLIQRVNSLIEKPTLLISASAVGFYGNQGDNIVDESTQPNEDFAHHLCEGWEAQARNMQSDTTRVCLLRLPPVLGHGGFLTKMLPVFKLGLGGKLGTGHQWFPWIHMDDLLRIIDFLIDQNTLSGTFNATSPNPITNAEFTKTMAKTLHRPAIFGLPSTLIKTMLGERAILLLNSQRVIPKHLQEVGFKFKYENLGEALANLLSKNNQKSL